MRDEVIELLLEVASAADDAMEDSEVLDRFENRAIDAGSAEPLIKALSALEKLPDIPGYTATGPAKARHALGLPEKE